MRNPVDIYGLQLRVKGVEYGYGEGMEAVLKDPNIDARNSNSFASLKKLGSQHTTLF